MALLCFLVVFVSKAIGHGERRLWRSGEGSGRQRGFIRSGWGEERVAPRADFG
jgi:hypothetical protein